MSGVSGMNGKSGPPPGPVLVMGDAEQAEAEAALGLATWVQDLATRETRVSAGWFALCGLDPATATAADAWSSLHPDDLAAFVAGYRATAEQGAPFLLDHRMGKPGAPERWVRTQARAVIGPDGRPVRVVGSTQDVTELRAALERASRRDRQLAETQARAGLGTWEWDVAADRITWSDQLHAIYGVAPGDFEPSYDAFLGRIHPDDRARVDALIREAFGTGTSFTFEHRLVRPDGGVRLVHCEGRVERDAAGAPLRMTGVCQDRTAHAEAEAVLATTHERLAEAMAIARMGRWEYNYETGTARWSDELHKLYGVEPGDGVTADRFMALLHPDDRDHVVAITLGAMKTDAPYVFECRLIRPDGEERHFLVRGRTVHGPDGRTLRQFGTSQDITDLRRTEAALRRSHAILVAQQASSPDGILTVDPEGRVIGMNPRFGEMWGFPPAVLASDDDAALRGWVAGTLVDPEGFAARVDAIYADPGVFTTDEIALKDGRLFQRFGVPTTGPDGTYYGRMWIFRDVTDARRLEAALQAQNEALRELDRLKSTFINAVSHELRLPLTSVMGYAELIAETIDPARPAPDLGSARDYLTTVQVNARRLQVLVDDLLDYALIEAGMFQLREEPGDFSARVREAVAALMPEARKLGLAVKLELPEAPVMVAMDGQRIGQVLVNLLSNALKFTPRGGEVAVRVAGTPGGVRCEVADAGAGVAPDDVPRLFQRYGQLEAGKRRGGSGLGLYISKALVEAHGGAIGVTTGEGPGAVFWFELPVSLAASGASPG